MNRIIEKLHTKDLEIDVLNEEIKTAYTTISTLQQRVSELENKVNNDARPPSTRDEPVVSQQEEERYLLLGDTNLQRVLSSDLDSCDVRTIRGANVDLLKCWVSEKLNWIPSKCFIYAGLYDLMNNMEPDCILDNITALVGELKEKNNRMDIYVSQLAPTISSEDLQARVADFNEHLNKWGESNNIHIIKTTLGFKLGTGEVDDSCYEFTRQSHGCILNRNGVVRLLKCVNKQYPAFKLSSKWDSKRYDDDLLRRGDNVDVLSSQNNKGNRDMNHKKNKRNADEIIHHHNNNNNEYSHFNNIATGAQPYSRGRKSYSSSNNVHPQGNASPLPSFVNGITMATRDVRPHLRHDTLHTRIFTSTGKTNNTHLNMRQQRKVGCYNCGEFNHRQSTCRFDHKLTCEICHVRGHKSRLCNYYSS